MHTVLIFHPTEELLLAEAQKKILAAMNILHTEYFPLFPLYCLLNSPELKDRTPSMLKKEIKAAAIEKPESQEGIIFFPVKIMLADGKSVTEKVDAARTAGNTHINEDVILPQEAAENFPINCRVFRSGRMKTNGNSWEIFDSVWINTKSR